MKLSRARRITLYRSPELRIIFLPCNKNASTSMLVWLAELVRAMRGADDRSMRRELASIFLVKEHISGGEVDKYLRHWDGYLVFGLTRNPYDRLASGYRNKINRLTKKKYPSLYWRAKVKHVFEGPNAWKRDRAALRFMHQAMSFESFVAALELHGVAVDPHFDSQVALMRPDLFSSCQFLKIEELPDCLIGPLAEHFRKNSVSVDLDSHPLPFCNQSFERGLKMSSFSPGLASRAASLYRQDFACFGYSL